VHSIAWWPTVIVAVLATITDLRSRRIPNWLTLPFLAAGLAVSGWLYGWYGIGQSVAGAALGLLTFGLLFWLGGMGAGDVKLCAAIGAWIGPSQLVIALVLTGLAGGVMVICWAVFGGFLGELFQGTGDMVLGWAGRASEGETEKGIGKARGRKMAYAPAIAIGTLMSFFAR